MRIAYYITFYEFGFAGLVILIMILQKLIVDKRTSHQLKQQQQFKKWLRPFLSNEKTIDKEAAKQLSYPLSVIINTLEDYDSSFQDANWQHIKEVILSFRALPWARNHSQHSFWKKRNLAARIFLLYPLKEDLDLLVKLLEDHDFYIRMLACDSIGKLDIVESIELLLGQMAKEVPTARFMFRHVLNQMPYEYLPYILKTYENASNDEVRICCLDLLTHRFYGNVYDFLHASITSENPIIRRMIAIILANIHTQEATNDLISLIKDPDLSVRKAALASLGKIQQESAFQPIAHALNDDEYTVRLQAALSLYNYGQKGISMLELQDSDINPQAHEVARFVLTLP